MATLVRCPIIQQWLPHWKPRIEANSRQCNAPTDDRYLGQSEYNPSHLEVNNGRDWSPPSFSVWRVNQERVRVHQSFEEQCRAPIVLIYLWKWDEQPTGIRTEEVTNGLISMSETAQPITMTRRHPVVLLIPSYVSIPNRTHLNQTW